MLAPPCRLRFLFTLLVLLASLATLPLCLSASCPPQTVASASSVPELKARADSGDASAKHQVAEFLISADPSSPHFAVALSWLQSLASQKVPDAQFLLGYLYQHGNGVPQDFALAFHWYRAAALHGNASAQSNLGTFYYLGYGTPVHYVEAVKWFRASAAQGFAPAQANLAFLYFKGRAVPIDYERAVHWARLAADQGHPRALVLLGYLSEHGEGMPLDYISAYDWYSRAIAAGEDSSAERLKHLSQIMTPRQLNKASSLASARSVSPQRSSDLSAPTPLSLFPNARG